MSGKPVSKTPKKKERLVKALLDGAAERLPKYKPYIDMVGPYIVQATDAVDAAYPYAVKAWNAGNDLWIKAQPYNPQQYLPMFFGLVLCFFGGSYLTIIAAVESVRLVVWQRLSQGLTILYDNYKKAAEASKKDDDVDADGNGIKDVDEVSDQQLLTRKLYLFARTVDPQQVSDAIAIIWAGLLSVVATLRIHFAQAITLGCSLGDMCEKHLSQSTLPVVKAALPQELQKWAVVLNQTAYKTVGVMFAWFLKRVIAGFHSSIRGANMFVTNAIKVAKQHKLLDDSFSENSPKASLMAAGVAFLGFYWQLSNGFSLPFPLNLVFLPVTIVEWLLTIFVGASTV